MSKYTRRRLRMQINEDSSLMGIVLAIYPRICMQIVTIYHSSPLFLDIGRSIKLSSPRLNNMAAVGCGLVYGAVILLGLDDATLPDSDGYYPTVCKVINIDYENILTPSVTRSILSVLI